MKGNLWEDSSTNLFKKSMIDSYPGKYSSTKTASSFSFENETTMAGILKKKGRKSGGMKKRYYEIKGNLMYYYLKKGDHQPRGLMYLPNKLMSQQFSKGKFYIKIYSYDSTTEYKTLFASSKAECEEWYTKMLKGAGNEDITLKYKMKETLGVGKFSTVRKGYLRSDESQQVAIKIVSKKYITEKEKEYIFNELAVLKLMNHPGIPKLYEIYETHEKMFIVMENIKDGELFDYLIESRKLPFKEATKAIIQLMKILKYLKELKIMHRDIKTENILLKLNKNGLMKKIYLIDFGLARFIDSRESVTQKLGTIGYCAPEVILKNDYNEAVDMWSVGIVYYLLLIGSLPFDGKTNEVVTNNTVNSPLSLKNKILELLDTKVCEFLKLSIQKNPKDRLSVEEGLEL